MGLAIVVKKTRSPTVISFPRHQCVSGCSFSEQSQVSRINDARSVNTDHRNIKCAVTCRYDVVNSKNSMVLRSLKDGEVKFRGTLLHI